MQKQKTAVGGSWRSGLTADSIATSTLALSEPRLQKDCCYWIEGRPREQGRQVIVRARNGMMRDMTPPPFSVRNRVHEYGGGAYTVDGERLLFCNDSDGGLYLIEDDQPARLLLSDKDKRFADLAVNSKTNTLFCICEDHSVSASEPLNSLVAINLDPPHRLRTVAEGEDFYASPAVSPDGDQLAWISWSHPDMPWDRTALWLADISNTGAIGNARCLLSEDACSVFQPVWSPDNRLYFSCDRDRGWWNIFRYNDGAIENLCPFDGEFALPQWQFAMSTSGFLSAGQMLVTYSQNGLWRLAVLCTNTGELQQIKTDKTLFSAINAHNNRAVLLASSPTELPGVYLYTAADKALTRLATSGEPGINSDAISIGSTVDFPTDDGSLVHGFFYQPENARYRLTKNELPPLIVIGHGGPTAATSNACNVRIQFWTSRGFAVLDVNYRGSTGYGRGYRQKLNGQWGVADVADCVAGAQFLVDQGLVDRQRLIIRGSSAGGFTALCALTFHDTFRAGASLYGIGDLETLVRDTHKFEAHYLDRLVGPYPESRDRYRQRSPIRHIEHLDCPVIFLQGLQDKVVPPEQAQAMVTALQKKGVMVRYVTFENEQHGFRGSDTIRRALHEELGFYGKVFGFEPAID